MAHQITVKTILNKTKRRDPWFLDDYTINPYSGCSFNCLYCYIRGSKYGEHMEKKMSVKQNAVEILDRQLYNRAKKGQYGIIVLSSATDPYLQIEKDTQLTRALLTVILKYHFPVHVITKSDLVSRDFDLLHQIAKTAILPSDLNGKLSQGCMITFSFSTIDKKIAKIFEPGATAPDKRLDILRLTANEGFITGVSMMPLLPFISDTATHLEAMFTAFTRHKAQYIFPATLTLFGNNPSDSKTLVMNAVKKYYPDLLPRYQKYFSKKHELPNYYIKAFSKKMDTMCASFGIRNRII